MDVAPWDEHCIEMVLDGIVWYCILFDGVQWYSMVSHGTEWYCMAFDDIR